MSRGIEFFNWFKRYKVRAVDMGQLQDTLQNDITGGWEGLGRAACLDGLDISVGVNAGRLEVLCDAGIATSASGMLITLEEDATLFLDAPIGAPSRTKIVLRPTLTPINPITDPDDPFSTVYLNEELGAEMLAVPASGSLDANDVVLAEIRLPAGTSTINPNNIDASARDAFGKYSEGPKGVAVYDQRMRASIDGTETILISPSQPIGANPMCLSYAGGAKPLAFPLTGGVFQQESARLNFTTGVIDQGDGDSPDFTPTIPTAGNFVWAVVSIGTDSLLSVAYGTQGTYAQCKAAMRSQVSTGAGAVPVSAAAKLCFVLVGSTSGASIDEIEIIDARGPGNFSTIANQAITKITSADSPYTMTGLEAHIEIDASGGAVQVTLPSLAANQGTNYPIDRIDGTDANTVTISAPGGDSIAEPLHNADYPMDVYESNDFFAGTTKWKVRG